jgi:hypothetical protein
MIYRAMMAVRRMRLLLPLFLSAGNHLHRSRAVLSQALNRSGKY